MAKMTKNGVSTTIAPGTEQYETFTTRSGRRIQYDYRTSDGVLFACVGKTLEQCRAARDQWLKRQKGETA